MIRINLLPESYRRAERTSPKVFAAALVGVILVCSSIGWFGMTYFGDLDRVMIKHQRRPLAQFEMNVAAPSVCGGELVVSKDHRRRP